MKFMYKGVPDYELTREQLVQCVMEVYEESKCMREGHEKDLKTLIDLARR